MKHPTYSICLTQFIRVSLGDSNPVYTVLCSQVTGCNTGRKKNRCLLKKKKKKKKKITEVFLFLDFTHMQPSTIFIFMPIFNLYINTNLHMYTYRSLSYVKSEKNLT